MKPFSIIGMAATAWVAWVILKDGSVQAGLADLKSRIMGIPTTKTTVSVTVPALGTLTSSSSTTNTASSNNSTISNIANSLDWGVNGINTSPDTFTPQGRAAVASSSWSNPAATWNQYLIPSAPSGTPTNTSANTTTNLSNIL